MKRNAVFAAFVLLLSVLSSGCIIISDDDPTATLTIRNRSRYTVYEVYLSPVGAGTWGSDVLGIDVDLYFGDDFVLHDIPCDWYDVRVVDNPGLRPCDQYNLELCANDSVLVITDSYLEQCP